MKKFLGAVFAVLMMFASVSTCFAEGTDGGTETKEIIYPPKLLVQSYECTSDGDTVCAGDNVRLSVTLVNTSKTQEVCNMTVTASAPSEFILQSMTDCRYIESVKAGATVDVTYEYIIKNDAPKGQYEIPVSYDYCYGDGMSSAGSGSARITVDQPLKMGFSVMQFPAEVVMSDTVEISLQAMNLSHAKAYNVRARLSADGLIPRETAFIGDLEGGTSIQTVMQVSVSGLTESDCSYGFTKGNVTFIYEDADGNELTETFDVSTNIKSPFSGINTAEEDDPIQWWIIMAVIFAVTVITVVIAVLRSKKHEKHN